MLRYLNFGERWYGDRLVTPYRRAHWEFQAVVAGRCAPTDEAGRAADPLARRRLWGFPPGHLHGWTGEPGQTCRIVVGHFESVPDILHSQRSRGMIARDLSPAEARRVEHLLLGLIADYRKPTNLSRLRFERAVIELTLLVLSGTRDERPTDFAGEKVAQALAWYREQMERRPSIDDVARAVFISPSQLRRLFAQTGTGSPRREMKRLQLDRAMRMVRRGHEPLDHVARACGFGSASDFSRVYRGHFKISPSADRARHQVAAAAGSRTVSGK